LRTRRRRGRRCQDDSSRQQGKSRTNRSGTFPV
jgi:hypothetical protein